MRFFNQIEGVWGTTGRVGVVGVKSADNLRYENRNGTELLSFLQKNNLKYFLKSITC